MSSVPRSASSGQTPALDFTNPRAVFVFLTEMRDALSTMDAIAADAMRPAGRRKLTRVVARQRLVEARTAIAWLVAATSRMVPTTPPSNASACPFETWAE